MSIMEQKQPDPSTVVFTACSICGESIMKSELRRYVNKQWSHATCLNVLKHNTGEPEQNGNGSDLEQFGVLGKALADYVRSNAVDTARLDSVIEEKVKAFGPKTLTVEVKRPDGADVKLEGVHAIFPALLKLVNSGEKNVYLHGSMAAGKSTAAEQLAMALSVPYGYVALTEQTPESRIFGHMLGGVYSDTEFYRLYTGGGVMFFDEMDNGSANLQNSLNNFFDNGKGGFPCGTVPRHPDFYVLAAGNTNGNGGNFQFPERRAFGKAFKDRFVYLKWTYDDTLERAIALGINPAADTWLEFVRKVREHVESERIELVVSPRASYKGARLLKAGFTPEEVAEMVIWKGLDEDTVSGILRACKLPKVTA